MFSSFFFLLRSRGLNVSLSEWLTLVQALDQGLGQADFTRFYYLARSILVKSEADYDKYDRAFGEYFEKADRAWGGLNPDMLKWLDKAPKPRADDREGRDKWENLSRSEIEQMFRERLREQKHEHNGGSYWIGTDGTSPFGNDDQGGKGLRAGGRSAGRTAMEVAGERRFRDFRQDTVLNARSFQTAFRALRQYSNRLDVPRNELNLGATIEATAAHCGRLELVFDKPRRNTVKLLLLMDSGGSMDEYSQLCAALFQAVSKSNHFKDLRIYYFHNCFKDRLFKTPRIDRRESLATDWVLKNLDGEYKVIIVGDALMDMVELTDGYWSGERFMPSGLDWLRRFKQRYRHLVWLNPSRLDLRKFNFWGRSRKAIGQEVPMYPLTVESLAGVFKKLISGRAGLK